MMKGSTGSYSATRDKTAARRGPRALFMVRYCICTIHVAFTNCICPMQCLSLKNPLAAA